MYGGGVLVDDGAAPIQGLRLRKRRKRKIHILILCTILSWREKGPREEESSRESSIYMWDVGHVQYRIEVK
jgi:hypothetical protein